MTVLAGTGAVGFKIAENTVTASTYETYVEEAANLASTDPEQCIQYYKNAIALNPSDGLAYENLLNFFLWEHNDSDQGDTGNEAAGQQITCVFSDSEEQEIRKVLGTEENRNRRNEEYLKANVEDYDKFAYDLGIAYYFSYNGTGNKGAARKWLEIASEAEPTDELNEANINRAANLYKISEYYDSLGMRNQAGDSMVSYGDYWRDLQKTVGDDSVSGNNVNMLLAYKEMISQIANNAANFKSAGITRQQMENELDNAVEAVSNMKIVTGSANAEYEQELKDNLIESLGFARTIVNSTFNRENLETDTQGGGQNAADTAAD